MCGTLRAARDEAVSSLAERTSTYADPNGNVASSAVNPSPSHSADSAIDLAEWETEQIQVGSEKSKRLEILPELNEWMSRHVAVDCLEYLPYTFLRSKNGAAEL